MKVDLVRFLILVPYGFLISSSIKKETATDTLSPLGVEELLFRAGDHLGTPAIYGSLKKWP